MFPVGRYTMFRDWLRFAVISFAASIRRTSINPSPCSLMLSEISFAAIASPSALITFALFSCSFLSTTNFARSLSCCATCFASTERAKSVPNAKCVMETSSRTRLNEMARAVSCSRIYTKCQNEKQSKKLNRPTCLDTFSLIVINSSALY